jgi:septal ring factor EnvC (AmiA/AmiB activator)
MDISFSNWLPGIVTAVFSGGVTGSIVALLKVRQEAGQIVVTAAEGALVVQTGVIENLRTEMKRLEKDLTEARKMIENQSEIIKRQAETIEGLNDQIQELKKNQKRHDTEIKDLDVHDKKGREN